MNPAWAAYRMVTPMLGAVAPAARIFTSPLEREFWGERLGRVELPGGCHAWIHAASLGEALAVPPLLAELAASQSGARFFVTATTRTGRTRLQSLGTPVALAPIDAPQPVRRFFSGVQPERLLLVETELWPHWLLRARRERVPVAVVSARLSERSVGRYQRLGRPFRALIEGLDAVLCQSTADERRWLALGARPDRTSVVGNLKIDALPGPAPDRNERRRALGLDPARPLLVLGSVRPGEVRRLARAWHAQPIALRAHWQVVVVPRHARATPELREEAQRAGQAVVDAGPPRGGVWRWDDRAGVLLDYYAAAEVAFVGGSLAPYGGHNPLEPAAVGAAVLMGHHYASQADGVRALFERGGVWIVHGPAELAAALHGLLSDAALRSSRVAAALEAVRVQRGAARRAVDRLRSSGLWPVS